MVGLAVVVVTVVVVILQEEVLVCAVGSEGDGGDTETGEKTLEAVPAAEGTGIAPGLTVQWLVSGCRSGCSRHGGGRTCEPTGHAWPKWSWGEPQP